MTFIAGSVAWLIVRRPARDSSVPLVSRPRAADADYAQGPQEAQPNEALARHPAGRARVADAVIADADPAATPKGPDDDVEFMRALDRAIRRDPPVS